MPEDPESKIGGTSVSLPPFLLSWPLCINDDGWVCCNAGCDPEWTWDGTGRRTTLGGIVEALVDHIGADHG